MSQFFYLFFHIIGIFTVFIGLGVLAVQGANGKDRKSALIFHGVGLVLLFVSGFGLVARTLDNSWPWWVFVKMGVWVALGAAVVPLKKEIVKGPKAWVMLIILGAISAYLGVTRGGVIPLFQS
mgnify:CR=1 FL=1